MAVVVSSTAWAQPKFVYPLPAAGAVDVKKGVEYHPGLVMDVYRPARAAAALPAVIFINAAGPMREHTQYTGWASITAAEGFVAINPDSTSGHVEENFDALIGYVRAHAAELHADPDRIALWAASGPAAQGFGIAEDPKRTFLKAAVFYYGAGPVAKWRTDLPVFYVRAGLDRAGMNRAIDQLAASAITANAPVTLVNHPYGHHGFDILDDTETSRDVIAATLRFLKIALDPKHAPTSSERAEADATAAASTGDFETATRLYAPIAAAQPNNAALQLSLGEALLGAKRYREALVQIEKTRGKVGPRDFGLPASRAAALAGDPGKAIEYLKAIPPQFLPKDALRDPAYQSLKGRPEFEAMLK